ncbi:MAG: DUF177 domain-containing protein [Pseudomonadota bacterium]
MTDPHPTDAPAFSHPVQLARLPNDGPHAFSLAPDADARAGLAQALGITAIRKLSAEVTLTPTGKRDWTLEAKWGATVVQPCVATLAPVTTRIDRTDRLTYVAQMPEVTEGEAEMPEDDTLEPLRAMIDLGEVVAEMLALALPAYPRADGAALDQTVFAAPGVRPMTDEDARPFAGLAALKAQLETDESDDDTDPS